MHHESIETGRYQAHSENRQIVFVNQRFERDSNGEFADMHFGPLVVHSAANHHRYLPTVTKRHLRKGFESFIVFCGDGLWREVSKRLENRRNLTVSVGSNPTPSANPTSDNFPHGTLAGHFKMKKDDTGQYSTIFYRLKIPCIFAILLRSFALTSHKCPAMMHGTF